jgi:hypothetical protein
MPIPTDQRYVDPDPGSLSRKKNLPDHVLRFELGEVGKSACSLSLSVASCGRRATRSTDSAARAGGPTAAAIALHECCTCGSAAPVAKAGVPHQPELPSPALGRAAPQGLERVGKMFEKNFDNRAVQELDCRRLQITTDRFGEPVPVTEPQALAISSRRGCVVFTRLH